MTLTATPTRPAMAQARSLISELGIDHLQARLRDFPDLLEQTLTHKREADEMVRKATEALAAARTDAEWELDGQFVTEANKSYLVYADDNGEQQRKQMTADERRAWKERAGEKVPAVASAKRALLQAEAAQAQARDAVAVMQARGQAMRHELDASVALLETLRLGLTPQALRLSVLPADPESEF